MRFSFLSFGLVALLFLCLLGCGSGGGDGVVVANSLTGSASSPNPNPAPNPNPREFGTLVLRQNLQNRAVAVEIDTVRIIGYALSEPGEGFLDPVRELPVYGPVERPKAASYTLEDVPIQVISIRLEYLQSGSVRGVYSQAVTILPDRPFEIVDPNYTDLAGLFSRVAIGFRQGNGDEFPDETIAVLPQSPGPFDFWARGFSGEGGNGIDISHLVAWESSDPSILEAVYQTGPRGRVALSYGGSAGEVNLTIRFADLEQTVPVEVLYPPGPFLTQIQFVQDNATLRQGVPTQLSALGTFSDGVTRDITSQVEWSAMDFSGGTEPAALEVTTNGVATALGQDGNAIVGIYYRPHRFGYLGSVFVRP